MNKAVSAAPFSKEELGGEFRQILFIQASQISHFASAEAARVFLGFECEFSPGRTIVDSEVRRVELARFPAWMMMSRAYDYAFQVGEFWYYDEQTHTDILALGDGMTPTASSGEKSPYYLPGSKCRHVIDQAVGRYHLEADGERALSVRHLSLLAGMSEAAVRNSLSAEKLSVPVDPQTALTWLRGRKGFVPSGDQESRQKNWFLWTRNLLTASRFSQGLRSVLLDLALTPEAAAAKASVSQDVVDSLLEGEGNLPSVDNLRKLGAALYVDVPHFVGQAIEASLRRRN